ncbi:hypothetical protein O3P69_002661 [Scylla paramamosain]|uniref:Uncharacterized protein n=1 Tax=Scylla paramamosain TaxID=85552 RepID=A0AAW0UQX2_SCYPA
MDCQALWKDQSLPPAVVLELSNPLLLVEIIQITDDDIQCFAGAFIFAASSSSAASCSSPANCCKPASCSTPATCCSTAITITSCPAKLQPKAHISK